MTNQFALRQFFVFYKEVTISPESFKYELNKNGEFLSALDGNAKFSSASVSFAFLMIKIVVCVRVTFESKLTKVD